METPPSARKDTYAQICAMQNHICAQVLALNVKLFFHVFKMDAQANLHSNQASGGMGCNCGWICIAGWR